MKAAPSFLNALRALEELERLGIVEAAGFLGASLGHRAIARNRDGPRRTLSSSGVREPSA